MAIEDFLAWVSKHDGVKDLLVMSRMKGIVSLPYMSMRMMLSTKEATPSSISWDFLIGIHRLGRQYYMVDCVS